MFPHCAGEFGVVYKAMLSGVGREDVVAVKTLKGSCNSWFNLLLLLLPLLLLFLYCFAVAAAIAVV
jgi:hypothetical protein